MNGDTNTLAARRDRLYARLEQGYARIERGLAAGEEVTTWEDFWVALLHEYDRVCDEIAADRGAEDGWPSLVGLQLLEQAPSIAAQPDDLAGD